MKKGKIFYGWWIVLGCMVITSTMVPLVMALSNKFLIQITEEMNITRSSFTLVSTILQALGIFLSPFVSKKLSSGNMKKIQSASIIGFVLAYASYSFAQNVWHLYISAFVLGICYLNATLIPVSMMITNWFVKKRGMAMSMAMAGIGVGGFIFSPIVTYFLNQYGWRVTYRLMALIVLVFALPVSLFVLKKRPEDIGLQAYGKNEVQENGVQKKAIQLGVSLSVAESKTKGFFWLMLIGMFANGLINAGALGHFPPAMEEMHGAAVQAVIISMYSLIGIFGKLLLGWINDRFGIKASTTFGCLTFGTAFVFMLLGENTSMLYIMAIFFGMGNAIGTVVPPLVTAEVFGREKYGEAYGIANSATQVGLSLGSLFVASIYDISGKYQWAWIILIILTGITYVGWLSACIGSKKYRNLEQKTE
ncbi:MFS transporter [Lachnospiraceae bacterium LCP25S3_G4]